MLLHDWDNTAEEGEAKFWELFLDLLMVAAAGAVADGLKENPSLGGCSEFWILFLLFVNGLSSYTHITGRFEDWSLLHIILLFSYILGTAIMILNASFEFFPAFTMGAIVQQSAVVFMLVPIYIHIPRAQAFCRSLATIICAEIAILLAALFFGHDTNATFWLSMVVTVGLGLEFILCFSLKPGEMVPDNIEHAKDRLGVLLLVMIGETVISTTIEYRRLVEEEDFEDTNKAIGYYWILFSALVLVFSYSLLYFRVSPPPAYHAYRRSRTHGCLLLLIHKLLCGSVLAVGVAVKLTIHTFFAEEEEQEQSLLTPFTSSLWSLSVGGSLLFLFCTRMLHYLGEVPRGTEPPSIIKWMNIWWIVFAILAFFPFFIGLFWNKEPIWCIFSYASLVFATCLIDSIFAQFLEPYVIVVQEEGASELPGETEPLTQTQSASYQPVGNAL